VITSAQVAGYLGLTAPVSGDALTQATDAANAYVTRVRKDLPADTEWPADVNLGAIKAAAFWYHTRGNPSGTSQFTELGGTGRPYLPEDVRRLLRVQDYTRPKVG
jgi:hypothetical protein